MTFKQRILRYMLGLAIGTVVVFFMFPQYDWLGWTPSKRIMQDIREFPFTVSPAAECTLNCLHLGTEQIQLARRDGSVDFDKSAVSQNPRIYHLVYGDLAFKISMTDSTAMLTEAMKNGMECKCD